MDTEVLKSYLVKLGVQVDSEAFNKARSLLNDLEKALGKNAGDAAALFAKGAGVVVGALAAIDGAIISTINHVAKADMEYQLIAQRMYLSVDAAKAFTIATKTLGRSLQEIAWNAELREQYFKLVKDINEFKLSNDAEKMFKDVRGIAFEFKRMEMLGGRAIEQIAYQILKLNKGELRSFSEWIKDLNETIKTKLPEWSKQIAEFLQPIIQLGSSAISFFRDLWSSIAPVFSSISEGLRDIWKSMEPLNRDLITFGALIAPFFLGSPFLMGLAAVAAALLLIDDYMGFKNGRESMELLIPTWKILSWLVYSVEKSLKGIYLILDHIAHMKIGEILGNIPVPFNPFRIFKLLNPEGNEDKYKDKSLVDDILDFHKSIYDDIDRIEKERADKKAAIAANLAAQGKNPYGSYLPSLNFIPINESATNWAKTINSPERSKINDIIRREAEVRGINVNLIKAMVQQESQYNPNAKSKKNALGLMQLMPDTALTMGVTNPYNAQQNIEGGIQFFTDLIKKYNGNIDEALAAYNWGPKYVDKLIKSNSFKMENLPKETRNFLSNVKSIWGSVNKYEAMANPNIVDSGIAPPGISSSPYGDASTYNNPTSVDNTINNTTIEIHTESKDPLEHARLASEAFAKKQKEAQKQATAIKEKVAGNK